MSARDEQNLYANTAPENSTHNKPINGSQIQNACKRPQIL